MSIITDALKKAKRIYFLIELDFDGLIKRYSHFEITVPNSGGDDLLFEGLIQNRFNIGSSYDMSSGSYSLQNVEINIANSKRFQDEETRRKLDGGSCKIYLWCNGLDWTDIVTDGVLMSGIFVKKSHNKETYSFSVNQKSEKEFLKTPTETVNTDNWPNHRVIGGAGSIAGLPQPKVFGSHTKGVSLLCVDTVAFKYIAQAGISKSTNAEFTAATENVYDKDGSVIDPANYTFYPAGVDGLGNTVAYFDFTADQSANEPLSCSLQGEIDGSGEITGTANTLLEHPADLVHYLLLYHTTLSSSDIHIGTLRTMRELLAGLKFVVIANKQVSSIDLIDRILKQCSYSHVQRSGKFGVVGLYTDSPIIKYMRQYDQIGKHIIITKTPDDLVCNNLAVEYALNPSTKKYEGRLVRDRTNNESCKRSYYEYGERIQKKIVLPDAWAESTAVTLANRYIEFNAFRHDIVQQQVSYWEGFDVLEGDAGLITIEEGSSIDGTGWVDEKCLLLDRKFGSSAITQQWWRIAT